MSPYKHLGRRFLVTLFGIPLLLSSMYVGRLFFLCVTGIILSGALWELYALAEKKGYHPLKIAGIFSALAIGADFYFWNAHWFQWILFIELLTVLTIGLFQNNKNHLGNAAVTIGGTLYLSCFSFFLLLRQFPVYTDQPYEKGGQFIMMVFVTIWICDTAAYFVGSSLGKHKLFARVSPRKTWEGAIAGFVISPFAVWGFNRLFLNTLSAPDILFIGLVVGTIGQMSDLIESLFKRDVDVKDSSNLLPGHGGMLDRFDSPLMVAPILYFYLYIKYFLL
jgi:phosphatidate cytidylyltransferase